MIANEPPSCPTMASTGPTTSPSLMTATPSTSTPASVETNASIENNQTITTNATNANISQNTNNNNKNTSNLQLSATSHEPPATPDNLLQKATGTEVAVPLLNSSSAPSVSLDQTIESANTKTDNIGPISSRSKAARPTPFSKPILLSADRRNRKRKSITWQTDAKLLKIHNFELIPDERYNVYRDLVAQQNAENNSTLSATGQLPGTSPNNRFRMPGSAGGGVGVGAMLAGGVGQPDLIAKAQNDERMLQSPEGLKHNEWRLILIDYKPDLPGPGWNSVERSAQAERETYVLGAIDLPGQPATLDEPDNDYSSSTSSLSTTVSTLTKNDAGEKIIPLDNPDGMYTIYPPLSCRDELVNGMAQLPAPMANILYYTHFNWAPPPNH